MRIDRFRSVPPLGAAWLAAALTAGCAPDDATGPAAEREPVTAAAPVGACAFGGGVTPGRLAECVELDAVRAHQFALQAIADANGGTRSSGTPGYDASVDYVASTLEAAGYDVTLDEYSYDFQPPAVVRQLAPVSASYESLVAVGSAVTAVATDVASIDLDLGPDNGSNSGCEASDFVGFPPGFIALIQRGGCTFEVKVVNAELAGAVAVILFNQGNTESRLGLQRFSLGDYEASVPVVSVSYFDGVALDGFGVAAYVEATAIETVTESSVIAETSVGDAGNVVVVGAPLDSPANSPGIQNAGSGVAAVLETAVQMASVRPTNQVRFAFWGGRSFGAGRYLDGLTDDERSDIALYLDFDMIGSPNYVFFVLDGDDSEATGVPAAPEGSGAIEDVFEAFYTDRGEPFKALDFDYLRRVSNPFVMAGVPSGGIFTGAEVIKTEEEAGVWGGVSGEQYDPCFLLACDTYDNISLYALGVNTDAVAFSTMVFGGSTQAVNGERGRPTPPRGRPGGLPPGPPADVPPGPPSR